MANPTPRAQCPPPPISPPACRPGRAGPSRRRGGCVDGVQGGTLKQLHGDAGGGASGLHHAVVHQSGKPCPDGVAGVRVA